jgi:hypothetical protein
MNRRPPRAREPQAPRVRAPSPLGSLLEGARDVTARAGGVAVDRENWRLAVGARIASRAEPGRLRAGVLTVYVASAAWAQELSFLTADILKRVVTLGVPAKSLRFLVRPELSKPTPQRPVAAPPKRAPLPEELRQTLASIDDAELRDTIATAASLSLARSEARAAKSATSQKAPLAKRRPPRDR